MKNILNFRVLLLFFAAAFVLVSCEDDGPVGGGNEGAPTVTLNSDAFLTLNPGEAFTVDVTATKGDADLQALTILEGTEKVDVSRLLVDGTQPGDAAVLLFSPDTDGFSNKLITINAHAEASATKTYEIRVNDLDQKSNSVFIEVTTNGEPPVLTTSSPVMVTVNQNTLNSFKLSAVSGSGQLSTIGVEKGGEFVDANNVFWGGISMSADGNPFALPVEDLNGFTDKELIIRTASVVETAIYTVTLTDEFGFTSSVDFEITTLPEGTPVNLREDEVLNQDGSAPGGLDLDTGDNVSSSSDIAEIIDNGIDTNLPASSNWFQTISPVNGTTMKYVVAGAAGIPESYSFETVSFVEDIPGLYETNEATTIDENSSSSVVEVGDSFIVKNGDNYWLLVVKEVIVTDDNNDDKYVFDVKY